MKKDELINFILKILVGILSFICTKILFDLQALQEKLDSVEKSQIYMMTKLKIPIPQNLFGKLPDSDDDDSNINIPDFSEAILPKEITLKAPKNKVKNPS